MSAFLMPSLGADMEAGTLVEQLVEAGHPVKRGDVIGAVETQKGVIEIETFEDGILTEWLVPLGTKVPVGTPLAMIQQDATEVQKPPAEVVPPSVAPVAPPSPPAPTRSTVSDVSAYGTDLRFS